MDFSPPEELGDIRAKVMRCFEAGALATGSTLETHEVAPPYAEVVHDLDIAGVYQRNAEALGRFFPDLGPLASRGMGSTDMGNVSLRLPSIHPTIGLASFPVVNHQPEFAAHCATPIADQAVVDGSLAMAWTAIDLAADSPLRARLLARGA